MTGFAGLFAGTLMNLAVHSFNKTTAAMTALASFHLMIIIEFCPILRIGMTADTVTRIMWFNGCFNF